MKMYYTDKINYNLELIYHNNELQKEFNYYKTKIPEKYSLFNKYNKIINFFQQNILYKQEKELWNNIDIRDKLIKNRIKYLNKSFSELTTYDILSGFKKSGIYYGYSRFNPLIIKKFHIDYNTKICYDPCGGWGDRLLGSLNIQKYIYNDLSPSIKSNIDDIINYFDIVNTVTYNKDACVFIPNEQFDTMFTCPPYFNTEKYECDSFDSIEAFQDFIDMLFNIFYNKDTCKTFGMVIREDLMHKNNYIQKFLLKTNKSHLAKTNKKINEYLYIFQK